MKRAAGYIRVSTTLQAKEGESLDTQKRQIEDFCRLKDWKLGKIYEDAGLTGSKAKARPGFMNMMADAKSGEFDIIAFTKLSRFARNSRDYYNYQHELEQHGIALASIKENIDPTTHNGKLMAGIFALLAEWERDMIREQMIENKMAKWRDKRMFNGKTPYGYYWDKKECKLLENKEEAAILNKLITMYVSSGLSIKDLILKLANEGHKTRQGGKWAHGSLHGMMKNPCYRTCKLITNQYVYEDSKRTKELKPEAEWIIYTLPRIIPISLLDRADRKRAFNKKKQRRTTWQGDSWLRDLLTCGKCGARISPKRGNLRKDGTFLRYYACYWGAGSSVKDRKVAGREQCNSIYFHAEQLEDFIWDRLIFSLTGQPFPCSDSEEERGEAEARKKFSNLAGNVKERIEEIQEAIARLEKEKSGKMRAIDRMLGMLEEPEIEITPELLSNRIRRNELDRARINELIAKHRDKLIELKDLTKQRQFFMENEDILFNLFSDLEDFSAEDKKRFAESLIPDGITLLPTNLLGPDMMDMDIVWNSYIFQELAEEGKLSLLDKDGRQSTRHHSFSGTGNTG